MSINIILSTAVPTEGGAFQRSVVVGERHHLMDRAPADHRNISVEEFVQHDSLQGVFFNAGNALGKFRTRNTTAQVTR